MGYSNGKNDLTSNAIKKKVTGFKFAQNEHLGLFTQSHDITNNFQWLFFSVENIKIQ